MRRPRLHLSPATVIASIALLVALGGTSAAAVELTLPRDSVGAPQLKNGSVTNSKLASNAVTSSKVANGSLTKADFRTGQIPAGPPGPPGSSGAQGPTGPSGPTGPTGPAGSGLWAVVSSNGNVSRQSGVLAVGHPDPGNYRIRFTKNISNCAYVATIGSGSSFGFIDVELATGSTDTVHVEIRNPAVDPEDRGFHLAVLC